MTLANLDRRLRRIEASHGLHGDLERMTDDELRRPIRSGYRALAAEHGSLAHAVVALRASGNPDDIALATLIEEDTDPDAARH